MRYAKTCGLALVGGLAMLVSHQAKATTLDTVTTLTAGGLEFYDFSYSSATLPASQVTVDALPNGGSPQLVFTAGWTTGALPISASTLNASINYKVKPVDPTVSSVNGGTLQIKDTVLTGDASIDVNETPTDLVSSTTYPTIHTNNTTKSADFTIAASSNVGINTNVVLTRGNPGVAAVSWVANSFTLGGGSGSTPPIPEPMSLALIPLGLAGLGLRKKLKA